MSEHEFEQFLTLVRNTLRWSAPQRDEIAAELRDHLEERLAELTQQGVPHAQAVEIALEEFGDAAELAAQFALILSHDRRRRTMKWTASSLTAVALMILGAYTLWPNPPATNRPVTFTPVPTAVAQEGGGGLGEEIGGSGLGDPGRVPARKPRTLSPLEILEQQLTERTEASFKDTPLSEVLEFVHAKAKVDFHIDRRGLEELGLATDVPVDIQLSDVRYDRLLDLVLGEYDLAWVPRDGYVFITTQDKLQESLETRVYNCRDLIAPRGDLGMLPGASSLPDFVGGGMGDMSGMGGMDGSMGGGMMPGMAGGPMYGDSMGAPSSSQTSSADPLIEVVTTTVLPDSWSDVGGPGSIAAYHHGLLVVNHHAQAHRRIEKVLQMLRDALGEQPGAVVRER